MTETATDASAHSNADTIVELINRDCTVFLSQMPRSSRSPAVLYRGMSENIASDVCPGMKLASCPISRKPTHSPMWLHTAMNQNLIANSGIAFRSHSMFCASGPTLPSNYGTVWAVFPIGKFDYAWSNLIEDPTYVFFEAPDREGQVPDEYTGLLEMMEAHWTQWQAKNRPQTAAVSMQKWVSDNQGALNERGSWWPEFISDFIKNRKLWLVNQGLAQACQRKYSDHEIMISCDKYYVVDLKLSKKVMEKLNASRAN